MNKPVFLLFVACAVGLFDCSPKAPPRKSTAEKTEICAGKTPQACWDLARQLEEEGNGQAMDAVVSACKQKIPEACIRFLDEAELTLLPTPSPDALEKMTPHIEELCAQKEMRACRVLDLAAIHEQKGNPEKIKKAFFSRMEACRQDSSQCISLLQALLAMERRDAAFYKANALSALQAACEGGAAEACHQDPLLQLEKRDLKWTFSFLLKGCEMGATASCSKLVDTARFAWREGIPTYETAEEPLKKVCFDMEFGDACRFWALGHIRKIWKNASIESGKNEFLRQCKLGSYEACVEFSRHLLQHEPAQRDWALKILRQSCADSFQNACVEWSLAMEKGSAADRRDAELVVRASCLGENTSITSMYADEYYYRYNYNQGSNTIFRNPSCTLYARYLQESTELIARPSSVQYLMQQGCDSSGHPICLHYADFLLKINQASENFLTDLYTRICDAGNPEGCLALVALYRRGFKTIKPSESNAKILEQKACRLDPRMPQCALQNNPQ